MNTPLISTTISLTLLLIAAAHPLSAADTDTPATKEAAAPQTDASHAPKPDQEPAAPAAETKPPSEVTLTPEIIARFHIVTKVIGTKPLRVPVIAPATVQFDPETTVHIGSAVTGRVSGINVKLGDVVAANAPLLTIDSPELGLAQNEWLQKRAAIAVTEADVMIAEQAANRANVLAKDNNIAGGELQRRQGELAKAKATLAAAKASSQAAENTLHIYGMDQAAVKALGESGEVSPQVIIRAAAAGTVIARDAALGEIARPDKDALVTLADPSTLWVVANVQATQAQQVAIGDAALILLVGSGLPPIETKVTYIAPAVDPETRAVRVRCQVSGDAGVRAGMYVDVEITPTRGAGAVDGLAVPRDAVFTLGTGSVVFVADPTTPGLFKAKHVAVAPATGSMVPIISGLGVGDQVVVQGGFVIKAEIGKASAEED